MKCAMLVVSLLKTVQKKGGEVGSVGVNTLGVFLGKILTPPGRITRLSGWFLGSPRRACGGKKENKEPLVRLGLYCMEYRLPTPGEVQGL